MNVDLSVSKEMIETLDYLFEKFGVVVDWSNGELLPYLQRLADKIVNYKASIAWLWIAVAIVGLIVGIVCIVVDIKCGDGGWLVLGIFLIVVALIIVIVNSYTLIGCKTFEEKIILDYLKSVMNSSSS